MPLGRRLNNPGNIRANPGVTYKGEVPNTESGVAAGFKKFKSPDNNPYNAAYGYRAMASLLWHYIHSEGLDTISKIINTYAPEADHNNPLSYSSKVSAGTGIAKDQQLTTADFTNATPQASNVFKIILAMARVEQGEEPNGPQALQGYNMFLNDQGLA